MREYYELPYVNKLDNLGEMDKFLEAQKLPWLAQEELEVSLEPDGFLRGRGRRWTKTTLWRRLARKAKSDMVS